MVHQRKRWSVCLHHDNVNYLLSTSFHICRSVWQQQDLLQECQCTKGTRKGMSFSAQCSVVCHTNYLDKPVLWNLSLNNKCLCLKKIRTIKCCLWVRLSYFYHLFCIDKLKWRHSAVGCSSEWKSSELMACPGSDSVGTDMNSSPQKPPGQWSWNIFPTNDDACICCGVLNLIFNMSPR